MSILPVETVPVEVEICETKGRGPEGQRVIQCGIIVWNSAPREISDMVSGRWEGCQTIQLSWDEMLKLHADLTKQIECLKPQVDSGKVLAK